MNTIIISVKKIWRISDGMNKDQESEAVLSALVTTVNENQSWEIVKGTEKWKWLWKNRKMTEQWGL